MTRLYRANADSISEADIVVIGVPDESKSHAKRKGASRGPDALRMASNESEFFERGGKRIPISPMRGSFEGKKIFDAGNVGRDELYQMIFDLVSSKKIPIVIGGDHSITTIILKAMGNALRSRMALLYFDAHPDFVSSTTDYYGSVLTDSAQFLDFQKSMLVGTRAAEPEELENARNARLEFVTPVDIVEAGVKKIAGQIESRINGATKYISLDLDCLDPGIAPGVSVPSPGGMSSMDLIYLLKQAVSSGSVAGIDIVELSPDFDVNSNTAYLAARILSECIASLQVSKR